MLTEVAITGAGPAAWALAKRLASAGRSVAVDPRGGHGVNALVMAGFADGPHRLARSLGDEVTRELIAFSQRGRELVWELGVGRRSGGLHASMGGREEEEVGELCEAWQACGEEVDRRGGSGVFGPCCFLPEDGVVEVGEVLAVLRERALAAGAVEEEADGEVRVLAGDHACREEAPFLADVLHPVRELSLVLEGGERFEHALRAQWGYLAAHFEEQLVVCGARWATPHLEVGERDLLVEPRVKEKLHAWGRTAFGAGEVVEERVAIETHGCDGLPLIGPLPGEPTTLVCTGFGRDELVLGLAAAEALAAALLGQPFTLPSLLRPHRML